MKKKQIILPLIVLAISTIAVWYIMNNKPKASKRQKPQTQVLRTEIIEPVAVNYNVWVPSYGIVQPKTKSIVNAQVSGQVIDVSNKFRDGAFFEKGDVLLIIDDADYQAQLTITKAELKQSESNYEEERALSLLAIKDWHAQGNTKAPPSLVARNPQLNSALSNLEASRAKLIQAQLNLKRTRITAPFSGRVLQLNVNIGQVVTTGTALGNIYAVDSAEIRLPIHQKYLSNIDLPETYRDATLNSNQITVKVSAKIGIKTHLWEGKIARVEGTIDNQTRQLYIVAEVLDPYKFRDDGTPPLKIGQFVNVLIKGKKLKNVIVLPRTAVTPSGNINVIKDGILKRTPLKILWEDEENIIIDNKFDSGQQISITPLGDILSGTKVKIMATASKNSEAL